MTGEIVGRDSELAALASFVGSIREGPHGAVLAGEAGAGKTTLLMAGVAAAREQSMWVLEARPAEAERALSFAALADLLGEVLDKTLSCLPEPQARSLRVALLLEEATGSPPDQRAVAAAFLGAVRALAAQTPVLVAVDDVQWLDPPSRSAIAFAVRRLRAEPVGIVLAQRIGAGGTDHIDLGRSLPAGCLSRIEVGPLSMGALHSMLHARLGTVFTRPALQRLHDLSGGNPFFALELARALEAGGGQLAPGEPLPVPARLHELVRDRLAALPAATRTAIASAAALSDPTVSLVGAALDVAPAVLDPAVEADIVEIEKGRIRFTHPLLASGAYESLGPMRRAELHASLAAVVPDVEERARHLAAAAPGPDEGVAAALDDAARSARARGATAAAADLSELAARLTPVQWSTRVRRRKTYAAVHHFESGDSRRARALLDDVLLEGEPGPERARALIQLARIRSYDDDNRASIELFRKAAEEARGDLATRAEALENVASNLFRNRERFPEAVEHAREAVEIGRRLGDPIVTAEALGSQLLAEAALGRPEARSTLELALALQADRERRRILGQPKFQAAVCWLWWDELPRARAAFEELLGWADEIGDESSVPFVLVLLGWTECLLGDFATARKHADEGLDHAEQAGQATLAAYLLGLRALVAAHVGSPGQAGTDGERALDLAGNTAGRAAEYLARWGLGLAALSGGDAEQALGYLSPIVDLSRREGLAEPGATRFMTDAVEALLQAARLEDATELLDWYEANARRLGRHSALASAARCRGLVAAEIGDLAEAHACLARALAEHRCARLPFDRARTLLALGAIERRAKRKSAARDALTKALAEFERLSAPAWAEKARAEAARIGGRAPATGDLTPTERRVAELVADGLSNKQVAARLFVSAKTVEGHLSSVYNKLGVHSRGALARRLAAKTRPVSGS